MQPHFDTERIMANSALLISAGNETTTSAVSSTLYLLLANPSAILLASEEVRGAFKEIPDITIASVETLIYLRACVTEAMRLHPPFRGPTPRQISEGGAEICGRYVPENSVISICQ